MNMQTRAWQGAKHSRSGTTASIRNAGRRPFAYSPFRAGRYSGSRLGAQAAAWWFHARHGQQRMLSEYRPVWGLLLMSTGPKAG